MDQHELTKKNNALMISMDRKREKNRVANESKHKALEAKKGKKISPEMASRLSGRSYERNNRTFKHWPGSAEPKAK